jgi:hypothetical protein
MDNFTNDDMNTVKNFICDCHRKVLTAISKNIIEAHLALKNTDVTSKS